MVTKAIIALLAIFVSACAQKQIVIKEHDLKPLYQFEESRIKVIDNPKLIVMGIDDLTQNRGVVGIAYTGILNHRADILTEVPMTEFFKARFQKGLANRGFDVVSDSKYGFKGLIKKIWVHEKINGLLGETTKCQFEMDFELVERKTRAVRVRGQVSAEIQGTNSILDATDSNGPSLETCISVAIDKFIKEPHVSALLGLKTNDL